MYIKRILPTLLFLYSFIISSCDSEDLFPAQVTSEVKVECALSDFQDKTASLDLWIELRISHGIRIIDSIGVCWNFDTENIPNVNSNCVKIPYQSTYSWIPYLTSIPVSITNSKIVIRGFALLNDTIIRYSTPLVLNNPADYAN